MTLNDRVTREFIAQRREHATEESAALSALSDARFNIASSDMPNILDRLGKDEGGSLKAFVPELRALADEAMPALTRYNEALDAMERSIRKARSVKAVIAALAAANATMQEYRTDDAKWKARRDALLVKASDPWVRYLLEQALAAIGARQPQLSLDNILTQRFPTADKLLDVVAKINEASGQITTSSAKRESWAWRSAESSFSNSR